MATTNVQVGKEWQVISTTSTLVQFNNSLQLELATGTEIPGPTFSGMLIHGGQTASYILDGETLYGRVKPQQGATSTTLILESLA